MPFNVLSVAVPIVNVSTDLLATKRHKSITYLHTSLAIKYTCLSKQGNYSLLAYYICCDILHSMFSPLSINLSWIGLWSYSPGVPVSCLQCQTCLSYFICCYSPLNTVKTMVLSAYHSQDYDKPVKTETFCTWYVQNIFKQYRRMLHFNVPYWLRLALLRSAALFDQRKQICIDR